MVSGAHGDPFLIEDRSDVMRMNALEREGDDAGLLRCGSDDTQAVDLVQPRGRVMEKILLVCGDVLQSD